MLLDGTDSSGSDAGDTIVLESVDSIYVGYFIGLTQSDDEEVWVKIIDVVSIEGEHDTYNFVDMETGTIIADGIITHNSSPTA